MQKLEERLGKGSVDVVTHDTARSHAEILPILEKAAFTLGGRYHTAISSLCMKTPVILTAGCSYKNKGLGGLIGMELPILQPEDTLGINNQAQHYLSNVSWTRSSLETGLHSILKAHTALAEFLDSNLAGFLEGKSVNPIALSNAPSGGGPLALSNIKMPKPPSAKHSRLRTQLSLKANIQQSLWTVQ